MMRAGGGPVERRPSVGKIVAYDLFDGWELDWVRGRIEFSQANSKGSRGVRISFVLEEGPVYRLRHFVSWKREVIEYIQWVGGERIEWTEEQAKDEFEVWFGR